MMEHPSLDARHDQISNTVFIVLGVVFVLMIVRVAWVGDDAYFTLRTVDNFVHGFGPTWNIAERVQAYTHPLWMLLLSVAFFFTREAFYTTIVLSVLLSTLAFFLAIKSMPARSISAFGALSALLLSRAYVDYSTSGLENAVTHVLLAAFLLELLWHPGTITPGKILRLALLAGLATLNRMDTILLYLPTLAVVAWKGGWLTSIRSLALGFMPFILWEVFAVIYYGFPFPNPAYAKLGTGIELRDLAEQGYLYFLHSLHWDPITLTIIAAALTMAFTRVSWKYRAMMLGVAAYLTYVLGIGGDFMSGRYFSGALLVSVILLANHLNTTAPRSGILILALILMLGVAAPGQPFAVTDASSDPKEDGFIGDERSRYFMTASLIYDRRDMVQPWDWRVEKGLSLKASGDRVSVGATGYLAYFAGPQVHLIDTFGLGDPLLSRMIPMKQKKWLIGHFERSLPRGYVESLEQNANLLADEDLARYYDRLRLVVRGPLWTPERLAAIWELNAGQLDYLLPRGAP